MNPNEMPSSASQPHSDDNSENDGNMDGRSASLQGATGSDSHQRNRYSFSNLSLSASDGIFIETYGRKRKRPDSDTVNTSNSSFNASLSQAPPIAKQKLESAAVIGESLKTCATLLFLCDDSEAKTLVDNVLETAVTVSGEPLQRLGAYMLLGLRARLELSRAPISKLLNCSMLTPEEHVDYMKMMYRVCPYKKFAYKAANEVITRVMETESKIHFIDFNPAEGYQWGHLVGTLAKRSGGPPFVRFTPIEDKDSTYAQYRDLMMVGKRLSVYSHRQHVDVAFTPFIHSKSDRILPSDILLLAGEAVIVNFPFYLHSVADDSVSPENRRNWLLRFAKGLSPKIVTLSEIELEANRETFCDRFNAILDYYTDVFDSIDKAKALWPRDNRTRIGMERHCFGEDIANMVACEGAARVKRYECFSSWESRFTQMGFKSYPTSPSVAKSVTNLLLDEKNFMEKNEFRCEHRDQALYLVSGTGRDWASFSAWTLGSNT